MRFSIVTPNFNTAEWIRETIESVLSQKGDFEIEYVIVDGVSTDGSCEIAEEYIKKIESGSYPIGCRNVTMKIVTQRGTGMYQAINQGFEDATGDIMAWINGDDLYEPGAFNAIVDVFKTFPKILWIKGITTNVNELGEIVIPGRLKLYSRDWIEKGIYGKESYFIEQDSVFWKKDLWKKAGPLREDLGVAADYALWISFAHHTSLELLNTPLSRFRKREGQLSKNIQKYKEEQQRVRPKRSFAAWKARVFFSPQSRLVKLFPSLEKFFLSLYRVIFRPTNFSYIEKKKNHLEKCPCYSYMVTGPS